MNTLECFITLDCREKELIRAYSNYLLDKNELSYIETNIKSLPIGDIIIYDGEKNEKVIIERKTMNDLASSINDGRYREQSFRLNNCEVANHNIYYVIEGNLQSLGPRYDRRTILSAISSLSYHKGFSVFRTRDAAETAEWLIRLTDKNKERE